MEGGLFDFRPRLFDRKLTTPAAAMSRPTVTVISPKGESSSETIAVPNVFKVREPPNARARIDRTHCEYKRPRIEKRRKRSLQSAFVRPDYWLQCSQCAVDADSAIGNNTSGFYGLCLAMPAGCMRNNLSAAELFANSCPEPHQARHCSVCSHWHEQEQAPALRRQREGWSPDLC